MGPVFLDCHSLISTNIDKFTYFASANKFDTNIFFFQVTHTLSRTKSSSTHIMVHYIVSLNRIRVATMLLYLL